MSQSIAGTNLATNAAATSRVPCVELRIAWGRSTWPTDWATQSQNETARMLDFSFQRQLSVEPLQVGNSRPAQLTVTLDNRDQRFSAFNTSSTITSDILGSTTTAGGVTVAYPKLHGSPVRLRVGYYDGTNGNEFVTVFSGRVDYRQQDTYGLGGDRLSLTVMDRGIELVDKRLSTGTFTDRRADQWIQYIVQQTGLTSSVDTGLFTIPYLWMDDETLWQECQDAAASECGYFFVDELGVATFKPATWWFVDTDSTTVQATITTANVQNLGNNVDWTTLATDLVLDYTPRVPGGLQDIYNSRNVVVVPPGTKTVKAKFAYPSDGSPVPTPSIVATNSGGRKLDDVTVVLEDVYAQRASLVFTNPTSETAFVGPFDMRTYAVIGSETVTLEPTITGLAPYTKTSRVTAGVYVQTDGQAQVGAAIMGQRLRYPRMTYTVSGFKAMPWLQLGDLVRVNVSAPYTSTRDMIIIGVNMAWRADAPLLQTLTGIDTAGLYEYDDYFILGTSRWNPEGEADAGRLWL